MELTIDVSFLVALTIGLTEVVKRIGKLTDEVGKRFLPAISLVFGVGLSLFRFGMNYESVVFGVVIGLTASGLFSGVKSTAGK